MCCISASAHTLLAETPSTASPDTQASAENTVHFSQLGDMSNLRLIIDNVDLTDADTVRLLCSVIDRAGRHVVGLDPTVHAVWNNVIEHFGDDSVNITNFAVQEVREHEAPPFSSVFVLDYSASMDKDITNVLLALERATGLLRPGRDDFSVVQFDEHIQTPFARATTGVALDSMKPFFEMGGMTAFYSASQRGLRDIASSEKNRVAVLISDGVDNASLLSANDIVREARAAHARLYIIGLANADRDMLKRIADQTGARVFFPAQSAELMDIFQEIYRLNNTYYSISYARPKGANRRTASVSLALPDGNKATDSHTYFSNPELIMEGRAIVLARFTESKMSIDQAFEDETRQIVQYLQVHPDQYIIVRAHTDTKGSVAINDRLSKERARVLAEYLIQRGVNRDQISSVQGMGKRFPLYPNDQDNPRLQIENRRGEVIFLERTTTLHAELNGIPIGK